MSWGRIQNVSSGRGANSVQSMLFPILDVHMLYCRHSWVRCVWCKVGLCASVSVAVGNWITVVIIMWQYFRLRQDAVENARIWNQSSVEYKYSNDIDTLRVVIDLVSFVPQSHRQSRVAHKLMQASRANDQTYLWIHMRTYRNRKNRKQSFILFITDNDVCKYICSRSF